MVHQKMVGRDSSVGLATCYGLEGLGIESLPIPVAERSKARVCGRSLIGVAGSNPAGAWMFVLCVLYSKGQKARPEQRSTEKVQRTKKNPGGGKDFTHQSGPALGPKQHLIQWVPGFFLRAKATGEWRLTTHPI